MKKFLSVMKEGISKKMLVVMTVCVATVSALVVTTCASSPPSPQLVGDIIGTSMLQGVIDQIYSILPVVLPILVVIIGIRLAVNFIRGLLH